MTVAHYQLEGTTALIQMDDGKANALSDTMIAELVVSSFLCAAVVAFTSSASIVSVSCTVTPPLFMWRCTVPQGHRVTLKSVVRASSS